MNGEERTCPGCHKRFPATKRICIACGIDLATGKALPLEDAPPTQAAAKPAPKATPPPTSAAKVDPPPAPDGEPEMEFALVEDDAPPPPPPPPVPVPAKSSSLVGSKRKAPPRPQLEPPSGFKKVLFVIGEYFPGLFFFSTLLGGLLLFIGSLVLWPIGIVMFLAGASFEGILTSSLALGMQLQGLTILIGGSMDIVHEALASFSGRQWKTFLAAWLLPWLVLFCGAMIYQKELSGVKELTPEQEEERANRTPLHKQLEQLRNVPTIVPTLPIPEE